MLTSCSPLSSPSFNSSPSSVLDRSKLIQYERDAPQPPLGTPASARAATPFVPASSHAENVAAINTRYADPLAGCRAKERLRPSPTTAAKYKYSVAPVSEFLEFNGGGGAYAVGERGHRAPEGHYVERYVVHAYGTQISDGFPMDEGLVVQTDPKAREFWKRERDIAETFPLMFRKR